ncbi:MAG TPA: patatin-like phospholipase family protein [Planctomycetota bacterium]|nr:patatin-like phospholipase family protein [Planctomycetota bacterium]
MIDGKKVAVVFGGGGMKGLAHIGALKALHRHGIVPDEYIGTSVGAYIGALAAGGLSPEQIEDIGTSIRRHDILDYDWMGLLWNRGSSRSLYRGKALHDFFRRTLPIDRWDDLQKPLYITSVDLNSAQEVIWGMPGYREIPIHDCVVASCSIPGIYPPKKINQYYFVDGSLVDTLPIKIPVYTKADLILAIFLEPRDCPAPPVVKLGVAGILQQSQSILSRILLRHNLHYFEKAPIVMIQPNVAEHGIFDFEENQACIRAGELATEVTLQSHPLTLPLLAKNRPISSTPIPAA